MDLLEVVQSFQLTMNLPKHIGRVQSQPLLILLIERRSKLSTLRVLQRYYEEKIIYIVPQKMFVCVCFVHARITEKLVPKALKCLLVGYSPTQKRYRCYHLLSQKNFVSMDVTFKETKPCFNTTHSPKALQKESNKREDVIPSSMTLDDRVQG